MGVLHQYVDWKEGTLATRYMAFIQLYVALVKNGLYIQTNVWSSSSSTSQRMKQATSEVFLDIQAS